MNYSDSLSSRSHTPRGIHAFLLLITSSLTVLLTAVIGPTLPQMQKHFADVPGANYLVSLSITAPMLVMAILSIFIGAIADRFGRKRMLVWGALLYAIFGTAPLWLDSLYVILVSRIFIGVAEAALITCSTTMIGDYYSGARRQKFIVLQTTVSATSAILLNMVGGVIGELGWRAPYTIYALSLLLVPLMQIYLWEPKLSGNVDDATLHSQDEPGITFRPALLIGICVTTVFGAMVFLIVPIHLGYLFASLGVESSQAIGLAYAANSVGVVTGTLIFGWVIASRMRVPLQIALSVAIAGVGFVLMGWATDPMYLTAATVVNGFGCGMLLPTLTSWNMRELPFAHRGLGTGAFMSSLFLGFFINPLIIVYLSEVMGGRATVVLMVGWVMIVVAFGALGTAVLKRQSKNYRKSATALF